MKTRISPDVFASAAAIASTMRSCSSLAEELLCAHDYSPARTRAAAAETAAAAAESAKSAAGRSRRLTNLRHRRPSRRYTVRRRRYNRSRAVRERRELRAIISKMMMKMKNIRQENLARFLVAGFRDRLARAFVFAAHRLHHRSMPVCQPAGVIAFRKRG